MIDFIYSSVYDELFTSMKKKKYSGKQFIEMEKFSAMLQSFWEKEGKKIIREIERVTKLKFKKEVDCYIVSEMFFEAISHPFTVKMCNNIDRLRGIMVHELIHILFVQNENKVLKVLNCLSGDHNYKVHFPVLLCERKVLENLHGSFKAEKRVEDLDYIWRDVDKVYTMFKKDNKGVINFLNKNVIN